MLRLARRPLAGIVAGVLVGAAGVAAMVVTDETTEDDQPAESGAAARAFVAAWDRRLRGTWVVTATFTRTFNDRRTLTGEIREAQRPPDRLRRGLGSTEGRVGDRRLACTAVEGAATQCREAGAALPYDEEVRRELGLLSGYVRGRDRLYAVTEDGGCFRLRLLRRLLAPPYGDAARFCFDGATGALRSVEVRRDRALDETRAIEIRATVTDADLSP